MENTKIKTIIGTVTMEYDEAGNMVSSVFDPKMPVALDNTLIDDLKRIECCNSPEDLKHNASLVLASYFNRMNKIELRDITKDKIVGDVNYVNHYLNGRIHKAIVTYTFEEDEPTDFWKPDLKRPPLIND